MLRAVKKLDRKAPIAALTSGNLIDFVAVAKNLEAEIISPNLDWITKEAIADLHAAGVRVIPWTANKESEWQRLLALEADPAPCTPAELDALVAREIVKMAELARKAGITPQ